MSINLQISLTNDSVKYIPVSFHEYGLFSKNSKQGGEGLRIYIPFRKNSLGIFEICHFTLRKHAFTPANSAELCDIPLGFPPIVLPKFPDFP